MSERTNWAANYAYKSGRLHVPECIEQLCALLRDAEKIKPLGTRHSFNHIADSETGEQISLEKFNAIEAIDEARRTVTVGARVKYGELGLHLHSRGWAVHNLASLPDISVVGACATATHGSGDRNGNLATAVCAMEMVTADGEVRSFSRESDGETFYGMVVHLGALGVVTRVTLELIPTFQMRQDLYEDLPMPELEANFDAITSNAYSVCMFTDWRGERINQVWVKSRLDERAAPAGSEFFGARLARQKLHPIPGAAADNCTEQLGVAGPWHERLPHFCSGKTPSSGEELQSEYFVPRDRAAAALQAVGELRDRIAPLLHISEIRTVAADKLWMSPAYRQPIVGIHFTWKKDWPAVSKLLPIIDEKLKPMCARPHWAKLFTMQPAEIQAHYPKLADFRRLAHSLDPSGKFRNAFLDRNVL